MQAKHLTRCVTGACSVSSLREMFLISYAYIVISTRLLHQTDRVGFLEQSQIYLFLSDEQIQTGWHPLPILFTIYFDELLMRLKQAAWPSLLHWGRVLVRWHALLYADDLTLLSPSLHGINAMLAICAIIKFAAGYSVAFNLSRYYSVPEIKVFQLSNPILNGTTIAWANEVKHLTGYIHSNLDLTTQEISGTNEVCS